MTNNMYRVGDYVYFETSPTSPFQIRRIEELNKTPSGNVEAKVMCFYRRRDLPNSLVQLADKHQMATAEDSPVAMKLKKMWLKTPVGEEQAAQAVLDPAIAALDDEKGSGEKNEKGEVLLPKQRHQMKHRELFLSRQVETLQATHIRGKCSVTLLNETESLLSYLNKDDTFFYCLVFDPTQKTLLADKGEIRVGLKYQTDMQRLLKEGEVDERKCEDMETMIWRPDHLLSDRKIDQFLVVSRSVGTFARALDCSSSVKQPSLHMSAAAASRDITLFHAMDTLHKQGYSVDSAMCSLVPSSGPVLCRDEMEEWSASEANLFEEALDKYGKDFNDIRTDFLPWKTLKNIVEYYYMWKTTDRYVQQKRVKAVEAESKLKQVYIPNYTKPSSNAVAVNMKSGSGGGGGVGGQGGIINGNSNGNGSLGGVPNDVGKMCESCAAGTSTQWYTWGPSHLSCRLCHNCWQYWKKYGGLKIASRIADTDNVELVKKRANQVVNSSGGIVVSGGGGGGVGGGGVVMPGGMPLAMTTNATTNNNNNNTMEMMDDDERMSEMGHRQVQRCSIVNCGKEFKLKTHLARHYAQAHGIAIRSGSPRPIMKTRTAFFLQTTLPTKLSRKLCRHLIKPRKAARQPTYAINTQAVKVEFAASVSSKSPDEMKALLVYKKRDRGSVTQIANKLGNPSPGPHEWLILTPKDKMPKPEVMAYPKPPKAPDGSLIYERIPNKETSPITVAGAPVAITGGAGGVVIAPVAATATDKPVPMMVSTSASSSLKRRHNDNDQNGLDRPPTKRPNKDPAPSHRPTQEQYQAMMAAAVAAGQPLPRHHLNGKPKIAQMSRTSSGRKHVISWMDAPDDVYFVASDASKKARRTLSVVDLRRAARKPWRNLNLKSIPAVLMVVTTTAASSTPSTTNATPPNPPAPAPATVPGTATASATAAALLPAGLPPGLSISNAASGALMMGEKMGGGGAAVELSSSSANVAAAAGSELTTSPGGGGGGGATGSGAMPAMNNGDLQVVILD